LNYKNQLLSSSPKTKHNIQAFLSDLFTHLFFQVLSQADFFDDINIITRCMHS